MYTHCDNIVFCHGEYRLHAPASIIVWEVGELCMFFWSSSELSTAVELERNGRPSDRRREDELDAAAAELAAALSLAAFSLPRFPYLFLRYLAQELRAAPSFSPVPPETRGTTLYNVVIRIFR